MSGDASNHNQTGSKIADLQVLRGISILLVMLCHFSLPKSLLDRLPVHVNAAFFLGVEIFFVLSGYVVCKTLLRDGFHAGRFMVRRAFRLYPAMLAFLALSWAVDAVLRYSTIPSGGQKERFLFADGQFMRQSWAVLNGTFLWRHDAAAFSNGAMWSLSVEFQFYAVAFLLCAVLVHACRLSPRLVFRLLVGLCAGAFSLMLGTRIAVLCGYSVETAAPRWLFYCMLWRFDFLTLGVLLAGFEERYGDALDNRLRSLGNYLSPWLLLTPLMLLSLCESQFNSVANKAYLVGLGNPVAAVCFAGLVFIAARNHAFPSPRGRIYHVLEWLGDRSYTIYLLHFPVFILAWMAMYYGAPSLFSGEMRYGFAQIVLVTALLLPICELVYRRVELPSITLGKKVCRAIFKSAPIAAASAELPSGIRLDAAGESLTGPHQEPAMRPGVSVDRRHGAAPH